MSIKVPTIQSFNATRDAFNPFPHTKNLQQRTLNIFCQIMENLYNWMDNLWLKVENIVTKGEIARFKKLSAAEASESVYMSKRVKPDYFWKHWGKRWKIQMSHVFFCHNELKPIVIHLISCFWLWYFKIKYLLQYFKHFPNIDTFWWLQQMTFENILAKGEIAHSLFFYWIVSKSSAAD